MEFNSTIIGYERLPLDQYRDGIKNEPMFFGASVAFVRMSREAVITNRVMDYACDHFGDHDNEHIVIDTRVHMLMPGWYPCIPGWHHDDVARTRSDGQPNYAEQPYRSAHILLVLNAHLAPTEFAVGRHVLPDVPIGEKVYQTWHPIVEQQIADGVLKREAVKDSTLVKFDWQSMHRGVPAVEGGWRYFFRATVRRPRHRNEVRRQVQVYVPGDINAGW